MKSPDPGWLPFVKMIFGFLMLLVLALLAALIALGDVRQDTSHGLTYILGGLTVLSGQFAQWAFGEIVKKDGE
jgi:thiol:disulfide interchange protein